MVDSLDEKIQFDKPHPARVWNYWLGGKDNYPADRAVGDAVVKVNPKLPLTARQCRQFLVRAVRYLAGEAGIRQFLDIGTGLPTEQNTHEVAQGIAPDSKVVYVDNDRCKSSCAHALARSTLRAAPRHRFRWSAVAASPSHRRSVLAHRVCGRM